MNIKLLTEQHLEFLSLKGGYTSSSESTLVKCHIVGNSNMLQPTQTICINKEMVVLLNIRFGPPYFMTVIPLLLIFTMQNKFCNCFELVSASTPKNWHENSRFNHLTW